MPSWFKSNAKWWEEGRISDTEILNAIENLLNKEIIKVGGRIHLIALQEPIARVFENLNLFKVFPYHDSLEDALSSIRVGG